MSIGCLIEEGTPLLWRGPMVNKALQQLIQEVRWGDLEFLLIDLPPGTGDAQLTLVQTLSLTGAILVTTPQTASVSVALRGAALFSHLEVPILGVVENMSSPEGLSTTPVFGSGGGQRAAEALNVPLLGKIPLDGQICRSADEGKPFLTEKNNSVASNTVLDIARQIITSCQK